MAKLLFLCIFEKGKFFKAKRGLGWNQSIITGGKSGYEHSYRCTVHCSFLDQHLYCDGVVLKGLSECHFDLSRLHHERQPHENNFSP